MSASYPKILYTGTQAAYDAIASKDANVLYWTSDTNKIYKGAVDFSKSVEAVASQPTSPAAGRLYLCADTGKAQFYTGSEWKTVNLPEVTSFTDENADNLHVATTAAIKTYVEGKIGTSADVVKSVDATAGKAGTITVTQADDSSKEVTVHDVFKGIADKTVGDAATPATFTLTDTDGDTTDYTVKGVATSLAAGATAAKVTLSKSSGAADDVTVPGVMTAIAAGSTAATVATTLSTGTADAITVPGVMTGIAAGSDDAEIAITLSTGTAENITVPGVVTDLTWDAQTRTITVTESDGSTGEIEIGKDIFIDPNADNRYEGGYIYIYLNDGTESKDPTELKIPVTGLVTDYFGDDTDSIEVDVDSNTHKVTASAILRADKAATESDPGFKNALKVSSTEGDKGLYVDLAPVEESIDALATAITWGTF